MDDTSVKELVAKMTGKISAEQISGVDTSIRINLLGENGGTWDLVIKDGECKVDQDGSAAPNLVLESTAQDFKGIINGTLDPISAFMSGKLKFTGDMSAALKLAGLMRLAG